MQRLVVGPALLVCLATRAAAAGTSAKVVYHNDKLSPAMKAALHAKHERAEKKAKGPPRTSPPPPEVPSPEKLSASKVAGVPPAVKPELASRAAGTPVPAPVATAGRATGAARGRGQALPKHRPFHQHPPPKNAALPKHRPFHQHPPPVTKPSSPPIYIPNTKPEFTSDGLPIMKRLTQPTLTELQRLPTVPKLSAGPTPRKDEPPPDAPPSVPKLSAGPTPRKDRPPPDAEKETGERRKKGRSKERDQKQRGFIFQEIGSTLGMPKPTYDGGDLRKPDAKGVVHPNVRVPYPKYASPSAWERNERSTKKSSTNAPRAQGAQGDVQRPDLKSVPASTQGSTNAPRAQGPEQPRPEVPAPRVKESAPRPDNGDRSVPAADQSWWPLPSTQSEGRYPQKSFLKSSMQLAGLLVAVLILMHCFGQRSEMKAKMERVTHNNRMTNQQDTTSNRGRSTGTNASSLSLRSARACDGPSSFDV